MVAHPELRPIHVQMAEPYKQAALAMPVDQLYEKAQLGKAEDQLTLGLAMYAEENSR